MSQTTNNFFEEWLAAEEMTLRCPNCGRVPRQTKTRYGLRSECCGLHSWDGKPLVCQKTHDARKAAHECFDRLWKSGRIKRSYAYQLLTEKMSMTPQECHMSRMNLEDALRVPKAVSEIYNDLWDKEVVSGS